MKYGIIYKGCLDGKSEQEIIRRREQDDISVRNIVHPRERDVIVGIVLQNYIVEYTTPVK